MTDFGILLANRFKPFLDDRQLLRSVARVDAVPIEGLARMDKIEAKRMLESALKKIYVASENNLLILHKLIGFAHAHCKATYPDSVSFKRRLHSTDKLILSDEPTVFNLTGFAGVGKSELINALLRVLSHSLTMSLMDQNDDPFEFRSVLAHRIGNEKRGVQGVLNALLYAVMEGEIPSIRDSDLTRRLQKVLFRDGICLLAIDEFQYLSLDAQANALVTKILLAIRAIGLPVCYVSNYSLGYKLLRRPQEDRDRLLANILLLMPDDSDGGDWQDLLRQYKSAAPEFFAFEVDESSARQFFFFTAGLKRHLLKLVLLAFEMAHDNKAKVEMTLIEEAYKSGDYAMERRDVQIINNQWITGVRDKEAKNDLWCPFEQPQSEIARFAELVRKSRERKIGEKMLNSALTNEEHKVLVAAEKAKQVKFKRTPGTVHPIKPRKKSTSSLADELLAGGRKILEGNI